MERSHLARRMLGMFMTPHVGARPSFTDEALRRDRPVKKNVFGRPQAMLRLDLDVGGKWLGN